jgi:NAD(P)-dependent dehydrogenase (short-subunit alcohol dehydrogenase family)
MQRGSTIAVISSVAGDRGRARNGIYGTSKAGLDAFLSALRQRLTPAGVRVLTVKPGFVDTPMTAHLRKSPLFASAASVGGAIVLAVDEGAEVIYVPWFWRLIMFVVRALPMSIFKRLKF